MHWFVIGIVLLVGIFGFLDYGVEVCYRWRNFKRKGRSMSRDDFLLILGLRSEYTPGRHIAKPDTALRRSFHHETQPPRYRTLSEGRLNNPPVPPSRNPDV